MGKANILLVSFHFYPSPEVGAKRPSETALHLARQGYDVTVLRAWEKRFQGRAFDAEGLELLTVRVPPRIWTALWIRMKSWLRSKDGAARANTGNGADASATGSGGAPRGLSWLGWLRRQLLAYDTLFQGNKRWLLYGIVRVLWRTRGRKIDLVIASGPPMVSYIGGWAAARLKRARLILDFRDPWYLHGDPELSTVMLGHPLARFENDLGRRCAASCDAITAASRGTKRHIVDRLGVPAERVEILRNGFDAAARIDAKPPDDRLEMLFAGSLYWNRDPFPFLEALKRVLAGAEVDRSRVRLRLIGNCEEWKGRSVRGWVADNQLEDVVEILPFMTPDELRSLVEQCNVLINFAQGQPRQIPAKSFEYIASRREVLVIAELDGDVADLFREAGVGLIVAPQDTDGFESAIRKCYSRFVASTGAGLPAIDIEPYSREVQVRRFAEIVERVLAAPASA